MGVHQPGQLLAGTSYEIVAEIGSGGMGVVYEVEHVRLKKRYVAKVIHDAIRNEAGAVRRMEREAQVLAALRHPNVVEVHDFGATTDGAPYFVMDKLEGMNLRKLLDSGRVPRVRAIEIVADILDALAYVHARGIVHRDIKPENVFLSDEVVGSRTKVLDFGIAHIFDASGHLAQARITSKGGFVGTLHYAAPEQLQGQPPGPATDVYAAALVLFELVAGRGPFDDDPGVGLSRCFKPAPSLERVARAPAALSDAVARALDGDPARRPAAGPFAAELREIAEQLARAPETPRDEALRDEIADLLRNMPLVEDGPAPDDGPPAAANGRHEPAAGPGSASGAAVRPTETATPAAAARGTRTTSGVATSLGDRAARARPRRGWTVAAASGAVVLLGTGAAVLLASRSASRPEVVAPAAGPASALPSARAPVEPPASATGVPVASGGDPPSPPTDAVTAAPAPGAGASSPARSSAPRSAPARTAPARPPAPGGRGAEKDGYIKTL
jgi:serine/threonine-protein kinase